MDNFFDECYSIKRYDDVRDFDREKNEMSAGESKISISFCSVLTILFIILKLCGVIGWSWWWVVSPLWLPVAAVLAIALIGLVIVGIVALITD
ncbi:hypothetical protein LCGC14_0234910 [marine sediment metagenome]|uniref:Transmembrane protein n=1 Tax=marine sediment metagenome TaxID=412755 RepID=A0A0F9U8U3_9ZZZZ